MWVPIAVAYDWIHNAAQILKNEAGLDGRIVQLCFQALLKAMSACCGLGWTFAIRHCPFISKLQTVTGQGYSTATQFQVYPEPIMTWSRFLAQYVIITVAARVAKQLLLH